jgi:hypothetical protein
VITLLEYTNCLHCSEKFGKLSESLKELHFKTFINVFCLSAFASIENSFGGLFFQNVFSKESVYGFIGILALHRFGFGVIQQRDAC